MEFSKRKEVVVLKDDMKIKPTPIQRNSFDVAVDLTKLYYKTAPTNETKADRIAEVFSMFFATAKLCDYSANLKELLPDNLKSILPNK